MGVGGKQWPFANPLPDWRDYKVRDYPEMVKHVEKCKELGLKDPWVRNMLWKLPRKPTPMLSWIHAKWYFRGFWIAAGLSFLTVAIDKSFGIRDKRFAVVEEKYGPQHGH